VRRHHANFCKDHFINHVQRQVERAIHDFAMLEPGDRILLGVSGGKDSLGLWDILTELGYQADGVYLHLGISSYSSESLELSRAFAADRGLSLEVVDLPNSFGFSVPRAAAASHRPPCSACGLSKRYILNRLADRGAYDVLAMGHNLDDEAATLFSNILQWNTDYLARQRPVLPATGTGLARKVKPLIRVSERETAAYAVLRGIDYEVDECPMAAGNTLNRYKEWLNRLEERSPGIKASFLFGFLERGAAHFPPAGEVDLKLCTSCGQPTTGEVCAFCKLQRLTITSTVAAS
jgi:uncharacterized protein (TIGR00269 family)